MRLPMRRSILFASVVLAVFSLLPSPPTAVWAQAPPNQNPCAQAHPALSRGEVTTIIQQAVTKATEMNLKATVAVTDREGNVLAVYRMKGASRFAQIESGKGAAANGPLGGIPIPSEFAAISKAGTCSFFGTTGNAFTPRSASFIIQEHIPPGVDFTPGGPLFGVQFSSLLFSDVNPKLPLGLSGDPGGLPLFKGAFPAGGIGVEVDGAYGIDPVPDDFDQAAEEIIAAAGTIGFAAPALIRADNIYVDGTRLPFSNAVPQTVGALVTLSRAGKFLATALNPGGGVVDGTPYAGRGSMFRCGTLRDRPVRIVVNPADGKERFPIRGSRELTASDVETILYQAINGVNTTRAAIRQPLGSFAEVNVTVVGLDGQILGIRGTPDAPIFGLDVSSQKARTSLVFSRSDCASILTKAGLGNYVAAAQADGVKLDGSTAFSDRGVGFLTRPFFPDGINRTQNGPLSVPIDRFSPFNNGIQIDLVAPTLIDILNGKPSPRLPPAILRSGFQIFAGAVPLFKGGQLVGAIGISGDGIDQDDLTASEGAAGFEAPENLRSDQLLVRGVRIPWVKFPRHPKL